MIKAEFIVNTGPYQHVAVTISGECVPDFGQQLIDFDDSVKARLGTFQAELESWVSTARQDALDGVTTEKVEILQSIGATVIETEEKPAEAARPWERKMDTGPKEWDPPTPDDKGATTNDDFDF